MRARLHLAHPSCLSHALSNQQTLKVSLEKGKKKLLLLFFFFFKEAQCNTQGRQDFYYGAAPGFHVIIGLLLQFLRAAFISMLAMQISVGLFTLCL